MERGGVVENNMIDSGGSLRDLLSIIFKHKRKMVLIFLLVFLVGIIVSFLMSPVVYEASSKILVKFGRENVYTVPTANGASPVLIDSAREERMNSEIEMLSARNVAEKVIRGLGVNNIYPGIEKNADNKSLTLRPSFKQLSPFGKAVLIFQKNLTVERVKKSNLIETKFKHKDPLIAAQVVNKFIDTFLEERIKVYGVSSGEQTVFSEQIKRLGEAINNDKNELEAFRKQNNITSFQDQKSLLIKQISDVEMEMAKTRTEFSENRGKLQAMEEQSISPSGEVRLGQETDLNPLTTSAIKNKLTELQLKEKDLLNKYTEQSGFVTDIRKEIEGAKQLLANEEKTSHDKAVITINQTLKALRNKEESLKQFGAKYQQELNRMNNGEMQLNELERRLKQHEESYYLYVKKMEETKISSELDNQKSINISVIQPALPPIKPAARKLTQYIILSLILGGIASFGLAFSLEYFSHTFNKKEDVEKRLGIPVLASILDLK